MTNTMTNPLINPNRPQWTREEIDKLRFYYTKTAYLMEDIAEVLPNRTVNAIYLKANRLGLKRPIPEGYDA